MFKRTEGAGLGSPPETPWDPAPSGLQSASAMHLDAVAAKFEVGKDYTTAEAKKLIKRVTRTPSAASGNVCALHQFS